jgi:hypothetical protein
MLSLLLITALAVQYPASSKPATTDSTAPKRTTAAPRSTPAGPAVGRAAFHDRMRDLWSDHVVYTRNFIISASAGLGDTAEVSQRLLRNQDEIGDAIKPYYGDAAGSQLASLLRSHIQLAGKALLAAKGTSTAMHPGMHMDASAGYQANEYRSRDTVTSRTDTAKVKSNSQYPTSTGRMSDTAKAKQVRTDSSTQSQSVHAQGQMQMQEHTTQVDSVALNQAIADLKANGDSIAVFLSTANPRGFARTTMQGAIQMHLNLLLQEVTAHLKKDWSGSVAAFDESQRQATQMADMLSEGIMKQFPSRFTNKATTVSTR